MIHHSAVLLLSPFSTTFPSLCFLFPFSPPPLLLSSDHESQCVPRYTLVQHALYQDSEGAVRLTPPMPQAEGPWQSFYRVNQRRTDQREKKERFDKLMYTACIIWQNVLRCWTRVVHWQTRRTPLNNDSVMKHIRRSENKPCGGQQKFDVEVVS